MSTEHSENSHSGIAHLQESTTFSLQCQEEIEHSKPDPFQDSIQGAWDVRHEYLPLTGGEKPNVRFRTELDPDDVKLVNELGQLSADKLMEYVRTLQTTSLTLADEEVGENEQFVNKLDETYAFNSPERHHGHKINNIAVTGSFGSSDRISFTHRIQRRTSSINRPNRSQSLEQNGTHSPSSSRSSSSNSYANGRLANGVSLEKGCLRQSAQPKFQISGDLNAHQIHIVKRTWKQVMKSINDDETEIAVRLLLRIFQIDPRNQTYFSLFAVPFAELRHNPIFVRHVKAFEPTLIHVMSHPTNATSLSKYLQQLGGRHVQHTGVTYKCAYWKTFVQALIDVVGADQGPAEVYDAFTVLGAFCVEQMRIGYKIEYKLLREARRLTLKKREYNGGEEALRKS